MIKDLHFSFPGFSATTGYCHLRVAMKSTESKMVIVCSQYKNYYGTSVTNAVETIAEKFFYDVANKNIVNIEIPNLSEYKIFSKDRNLLTRLLIKLKLLNDKNQSKKIYLNIPELFNNILWIERYPLDTGLREFEDDCRLVKMDEQFNPQWCQKISDEFVRQETGFSLSELLIDNEKLDLKNLQNFK
ncbi:hypothetical protein M0O54_08345 [Acinetobacter lactucae]|uniref:Uncharacterized protein n=1 Tax=Acinetobacter lactucae TaxID=1785128 RepID=A0AB35K4C8_9GAMM|nr:MULTISPECIES: hypothetical protein [Acinetobacter]MDD9320132.1 hypothetical protein [Acinetobacter lactucae]